MAWWREKKWTGEQLLSPQISTCRKILFLSGFCHDFVTDINDVELYFGYIANCYA